MELRAKGSELILEGHASVFDVWYPIGGGVVECIRRGAWKRAIADPNHDCCLLINHGDGGGLPLARTPRTLTLSEDHGLAVEARLDPRNPRVPELQSAAEHAGLDMSVGMRVSREDIVERKGATYGREIREANLLEVSCVTFGACSVTSCSVVTRSGLTIEEERALRHGTIEHRRIGELELRAARYTDAEVQTLGEEGKAFKNPDGHYSYPIGDEHSADDLSKAIRAVGRGNASHKAIRLYIMKRARELKLTKMIPPTWQSDGSTTGSGSRSVIPEVDSTCETCGGTGVIEENGELVPCPDCSEGGEPDGETPVLIAGINPRSALAGLPDLGALRERVAARRNGIEYSSTGGASSPWPPDGRAAAELERELGPELPLCPVWGWRTDTEKYTPARINHGGRHGRAFKCADGEYRYLCETRADIEDAVRAVRSSGEDEVALRRFIQRRARALDATRLLPKTYRPDGTVRL